MIKLVFGVSKWHFYFREPMGMLLGSKLNIFEKVYVKLSISPSLKGNFCILRVYSIMSFKT